MVMRLDPSTARGATLIAVTVEFECRTHVPTGVQEAFDRSRSIDLHMASMSGSRERAIAGVTAGLISEGKTSPGGHGTSGCRSERPAASPR
jgi:hypothetical protein